MIGSLVRRNDIADNYIIMAFKNVFYAFQLVILWTKCPTIIIYLPTYVLLYRLINISEAKGSQK